MHKARLTAGAVIAALALTATALIIGATPASADTQIGWVLDASGSVQCVVKSGTNNHVVCDAYWPGSPPTIRTANVVNDWLPYGCLGGAYMIAGDNAGTPAYLVYQNVSGYYCARISGGPLAFKVGTCSNGAVWQEGIYTDSPGAPYRVQVGPFYPDTSVGATFPYSSPAWPYDTCATVGYTKVGHAIYY